MGFSCLKKYQFNALAIIFLVSSCFFPEQLQNLSSPRLIGFDIIVTKKLNFGIRNVMYALVLDDCCIPHEGLITRQLQ